MELQELVERIDRWKHRQAGEEVQPANTVEELNADEDMATATIAASAAELEPEQEPELEPEQEPMDQDISMTLDAAELESIAPEPEETVNTASEESIEISPDSTQEVDELEVMEEEPS